MVAYKCLTILAFFLQSSQLGFAAHDDERSTWRHRTAEDETTQSLASGSKRYQFSPLDSDTVPETDLYLASVTTRATSLPLLSSRK